MKLSRVLAIALLGTVVMTNIAMASGTVAGTKITNTPTLSYSMAGTTKTLKAPTSVYVVDKVINFTISLKKAQKQNVIVGKNVIASFVLTNKGNSIENFVLSGNYGSLKQFKFTGYKIYVDQNNNGILDRAERKDISILTKLGVDVKKTIWIEATTSSKAIVSKGNHFGLLARATASGVKGIYTKQTIQNTMNKVDIVFADGANGGDEVRDNQVINRYIWTVYPDVPAVALDKKLDFDHITSDSKNGTSKSRKEAETDKFQPIANATRVKIFEIINSTNSKGKNIKVSIPLNLTNEKVSTTSKYTWWGRTENRVHIVWDEKLQKVIAEGKYNPKTKSIDFLIKEINAGKKLYFHVVTVLLKDAKNEKLEMKLAWNIISADPINGVCKDINDAKSGKYKAIPGATTVRAWSIINKTPSIAKNVKFSIKIDPKVEKVATTSKNTWWRSDKRVHVIYVQGKGNIGAGRYNAKQNSVDFFFKEIKAGESVHPHIVTEIK